MTTTVEPQSTLSAIADKLKEFLQAFRDNDGRYRYFDRINDMMAQDTTTLTVNYLDLSQFEPELAVRLTNEPDEVLHAFNEAALSILQEIQPDYEQEIRDKLQVRITQYTVQKSLRDVNTDLIGKLVAISGIQMRASEKKPLAKKLTYKCTNCGALIVAEMKGMILKKPTKCPACGEKELEIDPDNSIFVDMQRIKLQELPEVLPAGQLPRFIEGLLTGDLVDKSRPGDRVLAVGIVRLTTANKLNLQVPLFNLDFEVVNIEFLKDTQEHLRISIEDEMGIQKIIDNPNAMDILVDSFAPHVYGYDHIKKAILLAMVTTDTPFNEESVQRRRKSHILLAGDPGLAKSELLKTATKTAPRGFYTSGKGSSAAGLTAAVVKDRDGVLTLEAGAVVLGDRGLVCVDEGDKMKPEDRSALHEAMEQQTVTMNKGGIHAMLNARVSIIMALNPLYGRYDPYKNILENVNLPVPLLTRFDLIFVIRDQSNRELDEQILNRIDGEPKPAIETEFLSKYIAHAKGIHPDMSHEAKEVLHKYYHNMRKLQTEGAITITPRQYEGLKRLTLAHAQLLHKTRADVDDAKASIELMDEMFKTVGVDVNTGKMDLGVLYDKPQSQVSKQKLFMEIFTNLSGPDRDEVKENTLLTELVKSNKFSEEEAEKMIQKLAQEGRIYECRPKHWRLA